jgi:hypothetical protein
MKRIAAVVMLAGMQLAGVTGVLAQTQQVATPQANCDGTGPCTVNVTVFQCFITPNPRSLPVTGKNVLIFWEMASDGYRFNDGDGIKLKQDDSDFDEPAVQDNGKKFKLRDKNSKAMPGQQLTYRYNIKVQRQFGSNWFDCPPLDPIIVNQG